MPDDQLKKMLNEAKTKARNFVLCVNGSDIGLILSKKQTSESQKKEAKIKAGNGGKLFTGVVAGGPEGLVFKAIEDIPGGAAAHVRRHIKDEANLSLGVTFEKVDSLDEVNEDDGQFAGVTGGSSAIDVHARQDSEMNRQAQQMRDFLSEYDTKKRQFELDFQTADRQRIEANAKKATAQIELKKAKENPAPDDDTKDKIVNITKDIQTLTIIASDLLKARTEAQVNLRQLDTKTSEYRDMLEQFDRLTDFDAKFALMQHGRQEAIDSVRAKLDQVYEETNRKLVILGRTADTFEGDESWVAKHPKEGNRVLQEDAWSMAVNDAFINAGLDQKAEFAMISKFKDSVLAKIKDLLHNPGTRSTEELKQELRTFVRSEADPALFTGGRYNDGFAVSMVELEQLIDDGYVMMVHDSSAGPNTDLKDLKPTPVMVPSGQGQKIKAELADAVQSRDEKIAKLKVIINKQFVDILKTSGTKIKDSPAAIKQVQALKIAMDENRWEDAGKTLRDLQLTLA